MDVAKSAARGGELSRGFPDALRYPWLFRLSWSVFFSTSLYFGLNAYGFALLLLHMLVDWQAIRELLRRFFREGRAAAIGIGRLRVPLHSVLVALAAAAGISTALAVDPGRAVIPSIGMGLAMAFGLVYGQALQLAWPGWYVPLLGLSVVAGAVHVAWAFWVGYLIDGHLGYRVVTVFSENTTGTLLLLVIILGLTWFLARRDGWRWMGVPYLAAAAVALLLTYSRGAWFSLLAFLLCAMIPARRHPAGRRSALALLVVTLLALILAFIYIPGGPWRAETFRTILTEDRVFLYQLSWEMFLDHFWFGVGPSNFIHHYHEYNRGRLEWVYDYPHNTWLQMLTETGIVGGALFAIIIGRILLAVWRLRNTGDWPLWMLASGVVALLVRDQVDAAIFQIHIGLLFWWMAGTVLAAEQLAREPRREEAPA